MTKPVKMWAVFSPHVLIECTVSSYRSEAIKSFLSLWLCGDWKHFYHKGYRCRPVWVNEKEPNSYVE